MYSLKGKKVLIVGLGRSGVAAAGFAANRGAQVMVNDVLPEEKLAEALRSLEGIAFEKHLGSHDRALFMRADMVVVSPGVPMDIPGLPEAQARGVQVVGELELALHEIAKPIVAVTGTNGKTTTVELIGHLMNACGITHCIGGNIGMPLIGLIDEARSVDWVVLEVSSFQLETTPSLRPHVAVWLNATPDHLDRHRTFEEYVDAKARLFTPLNKESWGIYNDADEVVRGAVLQSNAQLIPFNPAEARKDGGWYEDGDLWVDVAERGRYRFGLRNVKLEGRHNRENMLAAMLATLLAGGNHEAIQDGLESFQGLPHRLEFVAEIEGVRFYDDSKGTNIGAATRALDSFAEPVVLIAGGQGKGVDFSTLAPLIRKGVKKLVLIGEAADCIRDAVGPSVDTVKANAMDEAVAAAWIAADPGDVVLLSPACASFDMFKGYAHRGEMFKAAVGKVTKRKRRTR